MSAADSGSVSATSRTGMVASAVTVSQQARCNANVPIASFSGTGLLNHSGGVVPPAMLEECRVPRFYQQAIMSCGALNASQLPNTALVYNLMVTSQLPRNVLGHIWSLVNRTLPGQLTRQEFYSCLALIALAQRGQSLSALSAVSVLPIPHLQAFVPCGGGAQSVQGAYTNGQQVSFVQPAGGAASFAAATRAYPIQSNASAATAPGGAPSSSRIPPSVTPIDVLGAGFGTTAAAAAARRPPHSQIVPPISAPSPMTSASNHMFQNTSGLISSSSHNFNVNANQRSSVPFVPTSLKIDSRPVGLTSNKSTTSLPSTPNPCSTSSTTSVPSAVGQVDLLGTAIGTSKSQTSTLPKSRSANMPSSFSANFPIEPPSSSALPPLSHADNGSLNVIRSKRPPVSKSIDLLTDLSFPTAFDVSKPSTSGASEKVISNGRSATLTPKSATSDQFGDFASFSNGETTAAARQTGEIFLDASLTNSTLEPSKIGKTDIYAAVKAIEGKLEEEQTGTERREVWKRCIGEAYEVFRDADVLLPPFSRDAVSSVARTQKGSHYIAALSAIYAMIRRISEGRSVELVDEEGRLREILSIWSRLKEFEDGNLPCDGGERAIGGAECSVGRCGICLTDVPQSALLQFAANVYHKQCANFWINRVNSLLPKLS